MSPLGVVDEAGLTRTGLVRRNNEDSYLIRGDLFMIADGMGGAAAGGVASALGAEATVQVDTFWLQSQADDLILLCSDGLTDMVSEDEFARILARPGDCEAIAQELVRAALAGGGEDNVTVVLFRIGERDAQQA